MMVCKFSCHIERQEKNNHSELQPDFTPSSMASLWICKYFERDGMTDNVSFIINQLATLRPFFEVVTDNFMLPAASDASCVTRHLMITILQVFFYDFLLNVVVSSVLF